MGKKRKGKNTKVLTICMSPRLYKTIKERAESVGSTVSQYIRFAMEKHLGVRK